ncbi:hypothetical protein EDB83DRAFT_1650850 [Lactarius deliciosus]|nr:hypothetical protein EDB83DRAFT_1650850 [Lactarius deliciosus]
MWPGWASPCQWIRLSYSLSFGTTSVQTCIAALLSIILPLSHRYRSDLTGPHFGSLTYFFREEALYVYYANYKSVMPGYMGLFLFATFLYVLFAFRDHLTFYTLFHTFLTAAPKYGDILMLLIQ